MTQQTRVALLVASVVVIVAAFVALRPSSDDGADRSATPRTKTTSRDSGREASGRPQQQGEEQPVLLSARDPQTISVDKGETVRFAARSERDDEVHVHGYDITREAPAGRTVRVRFTAEIEGVFEVELEQADEKIGDLEVRP